MAKNKKNLGKSIEERPEDVELREEFGHWEIDSVIGKKKDTEPAVMTIVERKLRMSLWIKVKNHTAEAIDEALAELIPQFGDKYRALFHDLCKHGKWHKIQNGNRAGKTQDGLPPVIAY